MYEVKVSEKDIDAVIDQCIQVDATGDTRFPAMTYEQGVKYALEWVLGISDDHPLQD